MKSAGERHLWDLCQSDKQGEEGGSKNQQQL